MSPGTELVTLSSKEVAAAILDGTELPEIVQSGDAARQLMEQLLSANDVDEILSVFESEGAQHYLDVPLEVDELTWRRSTYDEGAPVFVVIKATDLRDGSRVTLTTSGRSVMAGLYRMQELGAFPQVLQITKAKKATEAGFTPLQLKRAARPRGVEVLPPA